MKLHAALVTGAGTNQTTLPNLRRDLVSILTAFSPRSKERPADLAAEGDLDLLIATDCISEGQNLQDCDYLVNYDIHWNPVRRNALVEYDWIQREITSLRARAEKETQINRRVELNLAIRRLEGELALAAKNL